MTNQNNLKSAIERLQEAEKIIKNVINKGELSAIDRDMILEKLRNTYETVLLGIQSPLKDAQPNIPSKKEQTKEPVQTEVEETIQKQVQPKDEEETVVSSENISTITQPQAEKEEDELVELEEESAPAQEFESAEDDENQKPKTSAEIIGEKYQGKRKFRNESLAGDKKDVATKLQNKPIVDLSKSIGINDKFMYTKELFHGNAELYAKTIAKLNDFTDMNDAMFFIQENFDWDSKNEAANQLIELVRRKLMPGY